MKIASFYFLLFISIQFNAQVAQGDRVLGWQVDMAENNDYDSAFAFAADACMESIHMFITWADIEPEALDYSESFMASTLDVANIYYSWNDIKVELQVAPINTVAKEVPVDLADTPFDSPVMISRFNAMIDTMFNHIPDLELTALNIGNESDIYLGADENAYSEFKVFLDAVTEHAKARYLELHGTELSVGTTMTFDGLTDPETQGLCSDLNEGRDVIAVTYYPLNPDFTMESPAVIDADFDQLVSIYDDPGTPIYFCECGYSSSELCNSSESLQAEFYQAVFESWDEHFDHIKYLTIFKTTDWSQEDVEWFSVYYGIDDPIFLEYLRALGVRTFPGNGENKEAYETILCELEARDWCDTECSSTNIESPLLTSVLLYPNPADQLISVRSLEKVEVLTLLDIQGHMIRQSSNSTLSLSDLPAAIYIVRVKIEGHPPSHHQISKY
jgi:hypothetical protein